MSNKIAPERIEILKEYGFDPELDCRWWAPFRSPICAMDTHMLVEGDHATDHSYIIYAAAEEVEGATLEGLFYAPSLLEHMLVEFRGEWSFPAMLRQISRQTDCKLQPVDVGGLPMIFVEIRESDWQEGDLRFQVSDMLKVVGVMDHLLSRKRRSLLKKREGK